MNKTELINEINSKITTNGVGAITGSDLRNLLQDVVNSIKKKIVIDIEKDNLGNLTYNVVYSDLSDELTASIEVLTDGPQIIIINSEFDIFPITERIISFSPWSNLSGQYPCFFNLYEDEGTANNYIKIAGLKYNESLNTFEAWTTDVRVRMIIDFN